MVAILDLLKGKKTHLVASLAVILGILQGLDVFTVPIEAWPVIGALGLATLRAGVEKNAEQIRQGTTS